MVSVSKTLILVKSGDKRQENKTKLKNLSPVVQSSNPVQRMDTPNINCQKKLITKLTNYKTYCLSKTITKLDINFKICNCPPHNL